MTVKDKLILVCLAMKLTQATQAALQQYKERGYDSTLHAPLSRVVNCTKALDEYINVGLVCNIPFASVGQVNRDYEGLDKLALVNAVDFAIDFQNDVLAY